MTALQAKTNSYCENKQQTPNKRVNHLFFPHAFYKFEAFYKDPAAKYSVSYSEYHKEKLQNHNW